MSFQKKTLLFPLASCAASLLIMAGAHADVPVERDSRIPTQAELTLLPPYCPYTQIISKRYGRQQSHTKHDPATKPFLALYGEDFWHLHHYCFGLTAALRAYRTVKTSDRQRDLVDSLQQYDYVIQRVRQGSPILPELHLQKGISLLKLKRGEEAVLQLEQAIRLNPNLSQPYVELSNYYADSGKKALALQTLEAGLGVSPDAAGLKRRYAELGGTKTFTRADGATQSSTGKPDTPQPESGQHDERQAAEPIGTPGNPYCRFCP